MPVSGESRACQCGRHNRPDRRFCGDCGDPLGVACSRCGFANDRGDRFCGQCGSQVGAQVAPRAPAVGKAPGKFAKLPRKPAAKRAASAPRPAARIKPRKASAPKKPSPPTAPALDDSLANKLVALNRAKLGPAGTIDLTEEAQEVSDELAQDQIDALFQQ